MDNAKIRELANNIVDGLKTGKIEFDAEFWQHEVGFTPSYLEEKFKDDRTNNGDDFQEQLEWLKEQGRLQWDQELLEAYAKGEMFPSLKELKEYSESDPNDYEPDYIMFVPINDGQEELGCAVITVNGFFEYEFRLIEIFTNIEVARAFVKANWCL